MKLFSSATELQQSRQLRGDRRILATMRLQAWMWSLQPCLGHDWTVWGDTVYFVEYFRTARITWSTLFIKEVNSAE